MLEDASSVQVQQAAHHPNAASSSDSKALDDALAEATAILDDIDSRMPALLHSVSVGFQALETLRLYSDPAVWAARQLGTIPYAEETNIAIASLHELVKLASALRKQKNRYRHITNLVK